VKPDGTETYYCSSGCFSKATQLYNLGNDREPLEDNQLCIESKRALSNSILHGDKTDYYEGYHCACEKELCNALGVTSIMEHEREVVEKLARYGNPVLMNSFDIGVGSNKTKHAVGSVRNGQRMEQNFFLIWFFLILVTVVFNLHCNIVSQSFNQ